MKTNSRTISRLNKRLKKLDYMFIINILIIFAFGLVTIYSATRVKTDTFIIKEVIFGIMSIGVFLVFSLIDYRVYSKNAKLIYIFNILFLLSVYAFGSKILGATRWIKLGPINIQPSEFAKIFFILTFSEHLVNGYNKNFYGIRAIFISGLHLLPIFLLIVNQPDLGTSLVLVFLYMELIFLNNIDLKTYFSLIFLGIISIPIGYFFFLKEYQRKRILTFLNPEADILGSGWNVIQSMIAVGSGGVFGKGLFQGTQNKLKFLPESHTDFIFAVLSEELGFIGSGFLVILYAFLVFSIIKIGNKSEDRYGSLVAYGIAGIIFFHSIVNIGMVIGIMPVTGLPLLLMSYGGSSLLFTAMILGIVQSVKIYGSK
ncbi:MAG: rod shape determining protein RodA [Fusobacteriaceae bacterium]|nr:rod shape-determining protein RodA [Fusobacteriales bacterium]MDN5303517.1 rod shape determining protein RodA [Fusobacteriaceae bacterium]